MNKPTGRALQAFFLISQEWGPHFYLEWGAEICLTSVEH